MESCSFQNSPTHLRLKVTDPIGQVRYDFLPILNDTCSISYGYPCNTHGVYFGPLFRKNNESTEDLIPSIIYPNPANDELSIHFYAESNNQVKFTFINTLGEECKTFIPNNIIEGINTEKISTPVLVNDIPPGEDYYNHGLQILLILSCMKRYGVNRPISVDLNFASVYK
mgnify:CR=1 FL=1